MVEARIQLLTKVQLHLQVVKKLVLQLVNQYQKVTPQKQLEKIPAMRKAIAKAMVNSKHTAPHVTLMDEIDVQELWDHRKNSKKLQLNKVLN